MTPEARARQSIDALPIAAGWAVQDLKDARIAAVVDANLQRAQALQQVTLSKAFSGDRR